MPLRQPHKRGSKPAPRYQLTSSYVSHIHASRIPIWQLALRVGFTQLSPLSSLLHSRIVVATPLNIERIQRLADLLSFPRDQIFVEEPEDQP